MAKFPGWLSGGTQLLLSSLGQCLPSVFPTATSLCGAQGRIRTWHTCIPYIVKSMRWSMEKQVMPSRSKGAGVWVDGWMWLYLLNGNGFLSWIILFFETWLPPFSLSISSFFLGHASLACHLFSFWGNYNLTLFYFRDVLRERLPRHGAFIDGEWMDDGANS